MLLQSLTIHPRLSFPTCRTENAIEPALAGTMSTEPLLIATNNRRPSLQSSATVPAHSPRHPGTRRRPSQAAGNTGILLSHPGLIRTAIANLQDHEIGLMSREDLVDVIRLSSLPFLSGDVCRRLEYLSDKTLSRLTFLVRRCCRNQLDAHRSQRGKPMLWREAI